MDVTSRSLNVLFLCTGNSARSVIGEVLMRDLGKGKVRAFSAGSMPRGTVHPQTINVLKEFGHDVSGLRSKSWDEFASPGAPPIDFVFTVCDNAAHETCPVWPGRPIAAHWGIPDPAAATGSEAEIHAAFVDAYYSLRSRIAQFLALPLDELDTAGIKARLRDIR